MRARGAPARARDDASARHSRADADREQAADGELGAEPPPASSQPPPAAPRRLRDAPPAPATPTPDPTLAPVPAPAPVARPAPAPAPGGRRPRRARSGSGSGGSTAARPRSDSTCARQAGHSRWWAHARARSAPRRGRGCRRRTPRISEDCSVAVGRRRESCPAARRPCVATPGEPGPPVHQLAHARLVRCPSVRRPAARERPCR